MSLYLLKLLKNTQSTARKEIVQHGALTSWGLDSKHLREALECDRRQTETHFDNAAYKA